MYRKGKSFYFERASLSDKVYDLCISSTHYLINFLLDFCFFQIAERRKVISSIKSSPVDSGEDEASFEQGDSSFPNTSLVDDKSNFEYENGRSFPNTYARSTKEQKPEALPSAASREFNESENKPEKVLYLPPQGEPIKQLKDSSSEADWSSPLPSFLSSNSKTSTFKDEKQVNLEEPRVWLAKASTLTDEKLVNLEEPSLRLVHDEKDELLNEEVKPPPLAGVNVMNVIMVAAECAPWSKTGIILCAMLLDRM